MRWLALLGGVFLLVVWLVLREAPQAPAAGVGSASPAATAPPLNPPAAPPLATTAQAPVPAPPIVLRGVLYRGPGSEQSEAFLSVSGRPAQMFRAKEAVDQGWLLDTVGPDHAVIAKDGSKTRLAIVSEPGTAGLTTAAASSVAKDTPLPGFSKGGAPPAMASPAKSHEENQRFLQDRQKRTAGGASAAR